MGTKISEVMTARPRAVEPQTSVREAAGLMESEDVGSLPVVQDGARLVGVVTDRDIAIRVVARGLDPESTRVGDIASSELVTLGPDDDLDDALTLMAREQVRRLPVVVREGELVGVVSQADVAQSAKEKNVGEVVEAISRAPHGPRVAGTTGCDDDSYREGVETPTARRDDQSRRGRAMTSRPSAGRSHMSSQPFSETEIETLRKGATGAGLLVAVSDKGFFDTFKETGAMAEHLAQAKQGSSSPLIQQLAEGRGTGFGLTSSKSEVESGTLEALRSAASLLRSKAPEELGAYRSFVLELARAVSSAAEGGDEAEAAVIAKVEQALDEGEAA